MNVLKRIMFSTSGMTLVGTMRTLSMSFTSSKHSSNCYGPKFGTMSLGAMFATNTLPTLADVLLMQPTNERFLLVGALLELF